MEHASLVVWTHYSVVSDRSCIYVTLAVKFEDMKDSSKDPNARINYWPYLMGDVLAEDTAFPLKTYKCLKK